MPSTLTEPDISTLYFAIASSTIIVLLQKEHSDLIEKEMKIKQVYLYNFSK